MSVDNIVATDESGVMLVRDQFGFYSNNTAANNLLYAPNGSLGNTTNDANLVNADPVISGTGDDVYIGSSSAARGAAGAFPGLTWDFFGNNRSELAGDDIGHQAYDSADPTPITLEVPPLPADPATVAMLSLQASVDTMPRTAVVPGQAVNFYASSSTGDVAYYEYDFGDGTTYVGREMMVSHRYASTGSYQATLTVYEDASGATSSDTVTVNVVAADDGPNVSAGTVSVSSERWTAVAFDRAYTSPVVVATPVLASAADSPVVVRVREVNGSGFEVRLANLVAGASETIREVRYIAAEEGVYTVAQHGVKMEVSRTTSTTTDSALNLNGQSKSYANSYSSPVVIGQVMTANDEWSVFWSCGSNRQNVASSTTLRVGKHVGEDSITTRADETLGYIVIEAGSGTVSGLNYAAGVSADFVRGPDNSASGYTVSTASVAGASHAVVSMAKMDGSDGGFATLVGSDPVSSNQIVVAVDEDQWKDTERVHTTEPISHLVIGQ